MEKETEEEENKTQLYGLGRWVRIVVFHFNWKNMYHELEKWNLHLNSLQTKEFPIKIQADVCYGTQTHKPSS